MGNPQENGTRDPQGCAPEETSREPQMNGDARNPKTLDRDHGAEIPLARRGWVATTSERGS
jgi:hypothetical protein